MHRIQFQCDLDRIDLTIEFRRIVRRSFKLLRPLSEQFFTN